jgi:hypothetical protein
VIVVVFPSPENLDQGQKPEGASRNTHHRWHILKYMTQNLFLYQRAKAVARIIGTRMIMM